MSRLTSDIARAFRTFEQGRVRIDPAARALFCIPARDPKQARKARAPDRKAG
jgi:hypothetical protein